MFYSGFVVLLAAIIINRFINERGFRTLTPEEKLRLMEGFSASRKYSLLPLLVLMGAFWLMKEKLEIPPAYLFSLYMGLMIVYVIANAIFNQHKLRQLDMPPNYVRSFTIAQAISLTGVSWFFLVLLSDMNR